MHSHLVRLTILGLTLFGLIGAVLGQRPEDGRVEFDKKSRATKAVRDQLRTGEVRANAKEKDHVEAIADAARAFVYPLYWETETKPEPGKVNALVDDFVSALAGLKKARPVTDSYAQMLCKEVIVRSAEIIQHPKSKAIAGINAARLLAAIPQRRVERGQAIAEKLWVEETRPRLAEGNAEFLAETCLTLLGDAKITDGHRYHLYGCLASLVALPVEVPPLLKPETVDKILQKATEQIEKKVVFPKATPRQEIEGYKMLRQQAVLILVAGRKPTFGNKGRSILTLARIAGADSDLVPAPRLTERVEAAIGLAQMGKASAKLPDVQMDYVTSAIVSAVIEFGTQANANLEKKSFQRIRPWKVDAARLNEALDELKLSVKTPYVLSAIKECQSKVLSDLERDNNKCKANELNDWAQSNSPPAKSLFKSDPTSTIKGAAAAPE